MFSPAAIHSPFFIYPSHSMYCPVLVPYPANDFLYQQLHVFGYPSILSIHALFLVDWPDTAPGLFMLCNQIKGCLYYTRGKAVLFEFAQKREG